jgi:hypothetical protein
MSGAILQSGVVTPGHLAAWNTNGALDDAGVIWVTGVGVPTVVLQKGSIYTRTDGAIGSTLYVTQGAGVWNAVGGV